MRLANIAVLPIALVWAAVTNYHRPKGLNNKPLFLTVVEAGSLTLGWVLGEGSPLFRVYR